jgi:hypothetical protein
MIVERVSSQKLRERRAGALERLGMSLSEAREQWDEDGCCLLNGNWHNLPDLEIVKDADWLLDES